MTVEGRLGRAKLAAAASTPPTHIAEGMAAQSSKEQNKSEELECTWNNLNICSKYIYIYIIIIIYSVYIYIYDYKCRSLLLFPPVLTTLCRMKFSTASQPKASHSWYGCQHAWKHPQTTCPYLCYILQGNVCHLVLNSWQRARSRTALSSPIYITLIRGIFGWNLWLCHFPIFLYCTLTLSLSTYFPNQYIIYCKAAHRMRM